MLHTILAAVLSVAATLLLVRAAGAATTYRVGPGWSYVTPSDVPWESLAPGDSVLIHKRPAAYHDKWVICRVGTAGAPIVVRGVPDATGALPVIDGANAVTRSALNFWNENRGVIKIGGANNPPDTMPAWIVVESLDIRGARPENTYTGRDGRCTERSFLEYHHVQPYAAGGAAVAANIELRCRSHNAYEASLLFGLEGEHVVEIPAT